METRESNEKVDLVTVAIIDVATNYIRRFRASKIQLSNKDNVLNYDILTIDFDGLGRVTDMSPQVLWARIMRAKARQQSRKQLELSAALAVL